MVKTVKLTVDIPLYLHRKLVEALERDDFPYTTIADFVRDAIRKRLEELEAKEKA